VKLIVCIVISSTHLIMVVWLLFCSSGIREWNFLNTKQYAYYSKQKQPSSIHDLVACIVFI